MPANLPPQYFEAEKNYRLAKTTPEKIAALEEMLAIMPKHKGTDHLKAELRRRIAKLTQASERKAATQRASMLVEKEGAAQVVVTGPPNTGKSQLVSTITNASIKRTITKRNWEKFLEAGAILITHYRKKFATSFF